MNEKKSVFPYGSFRVVVRDEFGVANLMYSPVGGMNEGEATHVCAAMGGLFGQLASIEYSRDGETDWRKW